MQFDEITIDLTDLEWDESYKDKFTKKKDTTVSKEDLNTSNQKRKKQTFTDSITREIYTQKRIEKPLGKKKEQPKSKSKDFAYKSEDNFYSALNDFDFAIDKVKEDKPKVSESKAAKIKNVDKGGLNSGVYKNINDYNNIYPIKPPNEKSHLSNKVQPHINGQKHTHINTNGIKKYDFFIKPENVKPKSLDSQIFTNEITHLEISNIKLYHDSLPDSDNKYLLFYKNSFKDIVKEHVFTEPEMRWKFLRNFFKYKRTTNGQSFFLDFKILEIVEKKTTSDGFVLWSVKRNDGREIYLPEKVLHKMINSQEGIPDSYEKLINN
jgi:hypothetical protein